MNEIDNQGLDQQTQDINMISLKPDTQSTYDDSADECSVNMMETPDDITTPSELHIQYGHSKFWVMVDSGSSTSIVTKQMAKDIEARDSNRWWSRTTNPVKLKSYTYTPIKNWEPSTATLSTTAGRQDARTSWWSRTNTEQLWEGTCSNH